MKIFLGMLPAQRKASINLFCRHDHMLMSYYFIKLIGQKAWDNLLADFSYHEDLLLWMPKEKK